VENGAVLGVAYIVGTYITAAVTNAGLNPIKSLAVAFFAHDWKAAKIDWPISSLPVFIIAPLLGCAIALGISAFIRKSEERLLATASTLSYLESVADTDTATDTTTTAAYAGIGASAGTSELEILTGEAFGKDDGVSATPATPATSTADKLDSLSDFIVDRSGNTPETSPVSTKSSGSKTAASVRNYSPEDLF
jgi:hypothetical protein